MKGKRTTSRSRQPVLLLSQEEGTTRAAIDYKRLRRINPQAARQAVLEYLASANGRAAAPAGGRSARAAGGRAGDHRGPARPARARGEGARPGRRGARKGVLEQAQPAPS